MLTRVQVVYLHMLIDDDGHAPAPCIFTDTAAFHILAAAIQIKFFLPHRNFML